MRLSEIIHKIFCLIKVYNGFRAYTVLFENYENCAKLFLHQDSKLIKSIYECFTYGCENLNLNILIIRNTTNLLIIPGSRRRDINE